MIAHIPDSVLCDNCLLYNGQQCVSYGTCQGTYCLYGTIHVICTDTFAHSWAHLVAA